MDRASSTGGLLFALSYKPTHWLLEKMGYRLQYVEENGRKAPVMPWSARQTGIYRHRSPSQDFWLVVNPEKDSVFEKELCQLAVQDAEAEKRRLRILEDPAHLHLLLFSLHIDTWRWHLRYLNKELEDRVSITKWCLDRSFGLIKD